MIFDAFLFFNELDLLKIRLEELKDVVDRFVLVEAPITFSGASKPLYFELHRDIFSEYADRIICYVVPDMPRFARTSRYIRQFHQRNSIGTALQRAGCKPEDLVLVSDVDEIPCGRKLPEALALLESNDLVIFEQTYHHYYVNNIREHNWLGTYACRYDFLHAFGSVHKLRYGKQTLRRTGVDLRKTVIEQKYPHFPHGGWHLSWFGGPDAVLYKQQSYSQSLKVPAANRRMPYIRFNTGLSKLVDDPGRKGRARPRPPEELRRGLRASAISLRESGAFLPLFRTRGRRRGEGQQYRVARGQVQLAKAPICASRACDRKVQEDVLGPLPKIHGRPQAAASTAIDRARANE